MGLHAAGFCTHSPFPNQMWCDFKGWGGSLLTDVWKGRLACFFRREGRIKVGGGPSDSSSCGWHADVDIQGNTHAPLVTVRACSVVSDSETPWIVPHWAPPCMGFSRQEYWSGVPFPSPGNLPSPGIKPMSPALQADPLSLSHLGSHWTSFCNNRGEA